MRVNNDIQVSDVQLIDAEGENRGVTAIDEALELAVQSAIGSR